MHTVGQILKKKREDAGIDLAVVARMTKIQIKYLEALEKDDYRYLPSSTTARGFIKNYAKALDINWESLLAVFRRDFTEDKAGHIVPRGMVEPLSVQRFAWTPKHTIWMSLMAMLTILGLYFWREYQILVGPPKLEILSPSQNAEIRGEFVEISGVTEEGAIVGINGEKVDNNLGKFFYRAKLMEGENNFGVESRDKRGKLNKYELKVFSVKEEDDY